MIIFLLGEEMSVLWPKPPAVPGSTLLGKLKLSDIRTLSKPFGLRVSSFSEVFL